MRAEAFYQQ